MIKLVTRIMVLVLLAGTLRADPASMNLKWSQLSGTVAYGDDAVVRLKDGSKLKTTVTSVEPGTLVVFVSSKSHRTYKKGPAFIPHEQIAGLRLVRNGRKGNAALGLAIGLVGGVAAGWGLAHAATDGRDLSWGTLSAASGLLFGLAVGGSIAGYYAGKHVGRQEIRITLLPD